MYWWYAPLTKIAITIQKIDFLPQISKLLGQKSTFSPLAANWSLTDQCFQHEKGVSLESRYEGTKIFTPCPQKIGFWAQKQPNLAQNWHFVWIMCEWFCCLLCFRRTHVPTTRSCLNIHTAVFVIPNYLPMESCCHTSKTRVTCGIRLAIFSWWSGSNFMSSVLLVSIFKRGYSEKQKKGFFQKQMSDAHSWQRMLKTQSVHGIVTSRFCLFKNKGQNSPVH